MLGVTHVTGLHMLRGYTCYGVTHVTGLHMLRVTHVRGYTCYMFTCVVNTCYACSYTCTCIM